MQTQDMFAQPTSCGRDAMMGYFAHDMRTLLTIVQQCINVARTPHMSTDRQATMLQMIDDGVARAIDQSGEMLDFARHGRGARGRFDVVERVRSLGPLLGLLAGARTALDLILPGQACTVTASPVAFDAALLNLIANCRDAIAGTGRVVVRVEDYGAYVEVQVEDDGAGLRPADAQRAFEPFYTPEAGLRSGLGLGQVARFIRSIDGEIGVRTCAGRGTAISLYLPAGSAQSHWDESLQPVTIEHATMGASTVIAA